MPAPAWLAPRAWEKSAQLLQQSIPTHWNVTAVSSWLAFGPSILIFLAFISGFVLGSQRDRAWRAIIIFGTVGLVYALYALVEIVASDTGILFSSHGGAIRPLTGPFINRNHAATFFGSSATIWLALGLGELRRRTSSEPVTLATLGSALIQDAPWKLVLPLLAFMICITATFLTLSRAGSLLSIAVCVVVASLFIVRWIHGHPRARWVFLSVIAVMTAGLQIWGGGLAYRIGMEGLFDPSRRDAYRSTLAIIQDAPILGTGLGTFREVFPAYRVETLNTHLVWDFAHSTPLEFAAELGVAQTGLVGATWIAVALALARGVLRRRRDEVLPLAGFAVGILGVLHSSVDFSLQIPGYSVFWAALVGLGLAQSVGQSKPLE